MEFAILGLLWAEVFQGKKLHILLDLLMITAVADESIERFILGRSGQIEGVLIDCAGTLRHLCCYGRLYLL